MHTCYPLTTTPQGRKVMSMMVGSQRGSGGGGPASPAGLPAPTDGTVRLSVAGGELVAVLRFAGFITPQTAEAARQQLLAALKQGARGAARPSWSLAPPSLPPPLPSPA